MHGHADRARLVGHGSGDRLTDPPRGVRGELEALLPIEFLDGSDQAEVAFLDQVKEEHAASGVTLGERDDEAQVRLEQVVLGLLAIGGRPLEFALALEVEGVAFGLEQVLGIQASLDAFRKVDFLFGVEQRDAADLLEVVLDRVGGGARCDHTPLGVLAGGRERLVVIVITDHERALGFGLLGLGLVVLILVVFHRIVVGVVLVVFVVVHVVMVVDVVEVVVEVDVLLVDHDLVIVDGLVVFGLRRGLARGGLLRRLRLRSGFGRLLRRALAGRALGRLLGRGGLVFLLRLVRLRGGGLGGGLPLRLLSGVRRLLRDQTVPPPYSWLSDPLQGILPPKANR